jgi:type II secretory pathway component PulJ
MIAVIFLISIVLFVAIDFYLDLSRASNAASASTRGARRAVVLLDRVARDLEGAVMVQKPDEVDPHAHPWLFLAEADRSDSGADRVKFIRRGHHPAASDAVESDLEMVSWIVAPDESGEGDLELRRWSGPQPESLERDFPDVEHSDRVASGLASFGIKFQDEEGGWTGRWDSTTLAASSELPLAAEIEVSFRTGPGENDVDGPYTRRVLLPLRPIDLEQQLAAAAGQEGGNGRPGDEDSDGIPDEEDEVDNDGDDGPGPTEDDQAEQGDGEMTVAECLALRPDIARHLDQLGPGMVEWLRTQTVSAVAPLSPIGVPPECQ